MSGENWEKETNNLPDGDKNEKESYQFMDQVIKKRPFEWKKPLIRLFWIVLSGVAIGVIAAVVFLTVLPSVRKTLGIPDEKTRITIPADKEPTDAVISSSSVRTESVVTASSREEQDEPTPTVTPTVFPGVPTTPQTQTGLTVQQYKKLYQDMLNSADKPKHSLVQVIGISSEMDYFNQNYEDRKQVSGFMIAENDRDLFILTEYRAVANVKRIQVVFGDNSMADATVQKADENTGLAVVKVPLDSVLPSTKAAFVIATLGNSYYTTTGDPVLVLGSPMGYSDAVFFGVITSIKNKTSVFDHEYSLLTTDIEGSSTGSGILVNLNGEVIGVITQGLHQEGGSTITGISISEIKTLIQSLSNNETVSYAGIKGQEVTDDISTRTGIPLGLLTTDIAQDSPAMLAGIKEYDVIQEIAGQEIRNMNDLSKMIDSLKGGDVVSVKAMRKGASGYAEVNFSVTLSAK